MKIKSTTVTPGEFVRILVPPYSGWGIGNLVGQSGVLEKLQYFDVPGAKLAEQLKVLVSKIERAYLPVQTRVYRHMSGGRWQVGRVLEDDESFIFVQFSNGEAINFEAEQLQVRWDLPLTDPLLLLAAETTETPFLADARIEFVRAVERRHHDASGVSAVFFSSMDLVDYQFDVVRRVLTDPIQRYLLADEVGLGKTIEAAIIARQYFIDDATARAVLIVPPALVYQWSRELSIRFGFGNELLLDAQKACEGVRQ